MPTPLAILLVVLSACSLGLLVYWSVAAYHVARGIRRIPTAALARDYAEAKDPEPPSVCVIVPAHNEAECIALVARSILAQDYRADRLRMVFSLDRCTDQTESRLREALAGDPRAEIISVARCPDDWAGKTHAIWRGVNDSSGAAAADLLLFLDADTELHPSCIRACVALLRRRDLQMLSLLSSLTSGRWFERIVQPAAAMELMRQYPLVRANSETDRRPFANGQFILFRREAYLAFGGHSAVRDAVLEDVHIARHAAAKGQRLGLFVAGDMLGCRMYARYGEFVRGWNRIFAESASRRPSRLRGYAWRLRLVSIALPGLALLSAASGGAWLFARSFDWHALAAATLGAAGFLVWLGVACWCYALMRAPAWCGALYPVGAWLTSTILMRSASDLHARRPAEWAGREYARDVR